MNDPAVRYYLRALYLKQVGIPAFLAACLAFVVLSILILAGIFVVLVLLTSPNHSFSIGVYPCLPSIARSLFPLLS